MISPWDRGFLYGDGVFATLRTYGGRLFALDDHLELLVSTAATLRIDLGGEKERLREEAWRVVKPEGDAGEGSEREMRRGGVGEGPPAPRTRGVRLAEDEPARSLENPQSARGRVVESDSPASLTPRVRGAGGPSPTPPPLPSARSPRPEPQADSSELVVRLIATRGEGAGAALTAHTAPTILALAEPLVPLPAAVHRDGITVETRPSPGGTLGPKTLSYLPHLRALDEARRRGHGEVLWRDEAGALGQGATCNLLVALPGGLLLAPAPPTGRAGVTRRWVLREAGERGLTVDERPVAPDDLVRATEVMVCSTLREVVSVVAVDGVAVGTGRPGELASRLREALRQAASGVNPA